jgi:TRAP-type C4-dicarboxylate transport system substrate-binding protein
MKNIRRFCAALAMLAFSAFSAPQASAKTIRVATLAPKASSWGKIFRSWEKAVTQKTDGQLKLQVYYNGVHGMEDAMVGKLKARQLDGAVLSSVGLADLYHDILALQLPGVLTDWKKLDRVRNAMKPELQRGFEKAGVRLLSWADIGLVRPFSSGFAMRRPSDLKGKQPLAFGNDPTLRALYEGVGEITATQLSVAEVLPALRTGSVNALFAPGLAMEQLQWAPWVDHVTDWVLVAAIGGTVFRTDVLDGMPADLRETFVKIQDALGKFQTEQVRKDSQESYDRVIRRMKRVTLTPAERSEWDKAAHAARARLRQGEFSNQLVERVVQLAQ